MAQPDASTRAPTFVDVADLRDAHGLVARISRRTKSGQYTFAIQKEFERDKTMVTTAFVPEDMLDAYEEMVRTVRRKIGELRKAEGAEAATWTDAQREANTGGTRRKK